LNNIQRIQRLPDAEPLDLPKVVGACERLQEELENLAKKKILNTYPPIYDIDNSYVSQFEHTIYVKSNGIINLTENNFY
jgi:methionine aminopeptidase